MAWTALVGDLDASGREQMAVELARPLGEDRAKVQAGLDAWRTMMWG